MAESPSMASRACAQCGQSYVPKGRTQRYCGAHCKQAAARVLRQQRGYAERRAKSAARRCAGCRADISERAANAFYCTTCTERRRRLTRTNPLGEAMKKVARRPSTNTRPTTRRQQQAEAGVRDHSLPNYAGDWWPGWDGCYSPNLSPLAKELLERGGARFTPANPSNQTQTSTTAFRDRTPYEEAS